MKNTTSFLLASVLAATAPLLRAAPVEEIDLSTADDSAEERAKGPKVERTADGYIDVMCDDATISSVLQQFRRTTRMNILSTESSNLTRRVSASLTHVPWCSALQSILGLANFKMDERDGIWYVSEKTPDEVTNATRYFVLKHASAVDLADLFNGVAMKTSYEERSSIRALKTTNQPGLLNDGAGRTEADGSTQIKSAIAGRARATAFPNTNTLILTGPETNLLECEKIVQELDRPVTQVYIEARFIQLSAEAMHKLGVKWDQLQSWGMSVKNVKAGFESNDGHAADYGNGLTQKSANGTTTHSTTQSSNESDTESASASMPSESSTTSTGKSKSTSSSANDNATKSDNSSYTGLFPTSIGEAVGAGASAASMGWRDASTFSGQLSADDFRLALSAFEQLQEGKIFSNPRIIVANGKEARVDMTTKEPNVIVNSDRTGTEGQYLSVSTKLETIPGTDRNLFAGEAFFSYGITLSVRPRVSASGLIAVEVVPTISEKKTDKSIAGADASSIYTTYPIINIKSINTEFTMQNGATAVIGGLSRTEEQDVDSGIPYLRKIPWIGPKLFGWQSREKAQSEILVLVTVGIANPETLRKDAGLPTNAVLGREYVEGRRLEPGERPNALKSISSVDTRTLDEIREDPYLKNQKDDESIDLEDKPAFAPGANETPAENEPAKEAEEPAKETNEPAKEAEEAFLELEKPAAVETKPVETVVEPLPSGGTKTVRRVRRQG